MLKQGFGSILWFLLFIFCENIYAQQPTIKFQTDSIKKLNRYKNSFLIAPVISKTPETDWAFALASIYVFKTNAGDSNLRTSTVPIMAAYTTRKQFILASNSTIYFPREQFVLKFEFSYSDFIDKFWGLGNSTSYRNFEWYYYNQAFISAQIDKKLFFGTFWGLGWEFQNVIKNDYTKSGYFDQDNVIGRGPYQISGPTAFFTFDTRNHAYLPNRGTMIKLKYGGFFLGTGSSYRFDLVEIDFRKFIKIYQNITLGIQAYQYYTFGETPFRSLGNMGGNTMMRGYYAGRFRDKMYVMTQAELRFPIYKRFSGVVFGGLGQVGNKFKDFDFEKLKFSVGSGIRFAVLKKDKLNLRFDVAWGNYGNFNYYIILSESF